MGLRLALGWSDPLGYLSDLAIGVYSAGLGRRDTSTPVLVAGIQAYVFTILTCVYLKDALHPGH